MKTKDFHFGAQDLMSLLVHYTGGLVPLNGEVKEILVNPRMQRKIALVVASDEWKDETPLFLGYDGKRISSWTKGDEQHLIRQYAETPNRQ